MERGSTAVSFLTGRSKTPSVGAHACVNTHKCAAIAFASTLLKGNYQTEFCDRAPEGTAQTCQNIGTNAKYAQRVKDNPALALFNRAYKRYHARLKVGSVKPDAFKKWKYEAVVMRDRCLGGEIAASEFEAWLDGYFGRMGTAVEGD